MAGKPSPTPETETFRQAVWSVVRRIPRGKVSTYGQVAKLAGRPQAARAAGAALAALEGPMARQVPWHRVVASGGKLATRRDEGPDQQRSLLEGEGIRFTRGGSVDLKRYAWKPPELKPARGRGGPRGSGGPRGGGSRGTVTREGGPRRRTREITFPR